ncbi:MAG TPA: lytic transglycosylase domain-containing protein [Longimicrobiaceae bacterium]|nr:lytic transglycosylase domain-containing protein [Longimicrobiaceae bacterium]
MGRPHRRFPDAAGEAPARYRRAFDGAGDKRVNEGVRLRRRRSTFDRLRQNPVRHGIIGLSIVGTAAPLAVARYASMRTDPSHEQVLNFTPAMPLSDQAVGQAWQTAKTEVEETRTTERDTLIEEKLERYQELGLERELAETIYDLALESDIDPDIAFGLVRTESEFKTQATSHVGAIGLTQLMPSTAKWFQPGIQTRDLRDPKTNLSIGFRYLRELIDKYDGDERMALLAYNRGPGTVDRVLKRGGDPDNGYAEAVLTGRGVH